jgi:hypothetical protein
VAAPGRTSRTARPAERGPRPAERAGVGRGAGIAPAGPADRGAHAARRHGRQSGPPRVRRSPSRRGRRHPTPALSVLTQADAMAMARESRRERTVLEGGSTRPRTTRGSRGGPASGRLGWRWRRLRETEPTSSARRFWQDSWMRASR